MSKTKQRTHSEVEYLRGQIKKLKSEKRSLERRNKELERKSHFYEEVMDETVEEVDFKNSCPNCKSGQVIEYNFVHLIVQKCDKCDYQKRIKAKK